MPLPTPGDEAPIGSFLIFQIQYTTGIDYAKKNSAPSDGSSEVFHPRCGKQSAGELFSNNRESIR